MGWHCSFSSHWFDLAKPKKPKHLRFFSTATRRSGEADALIWFGEAIRFAEKPNCFALIWFGEAKLLRWPKEPIRTAVHWRSQTALRWAVWLRQCQRSQRSQSALHREAVGKAPCFALIWFGFIGFAKSNQCTTELCFAPRSGLASPMSNELLNKFILFLLYTNSTEHL